MNQIFTKKFYVFLCFLLAGTVTAYSQTCTGPVACETSIDENFAGGPGTFTLGMDFTATGGALVSQNRGMGGSSTATRQLDTLNSGIYVGGAINSVLTFRFTLRTIRSSGNFTAYRILARYGSGDNNVVAICTGGALQNGVPICLNTITPAAFAGKRFRFEFIFTLGGTNNQAQASFDDFATNAAESASQIPLPVTFKSFNAKKAAGGTVLTWNVGGERDVKAYEIERSNNGKSLFTKIGLVPATGSDTYTFTDAASHSGVVFYRIRNVDVDGKFSYTNVLSFANGIASTVFKVVPTVVVSKATVQHETAGVNSLFTLSTADGKQVKVQRPAAGSLQTIVDLSGLRAGTYLLQFNNGNGHIETTKIVKQ